MECVIFVQRGRRRVVIYSRKTGMYKSPTLSGRSETGMSSATEGIYLGLIVSLDIGTDCVT